MHFPMRSSFLLSALLPLATMAQPPGLVVVADSTDPAEVEERFADRALVMVVAPDESSRDRLDRGFRAAGRIGQFIAVHPTLDGRIPLADRSAAAVHEGDIAGLAATEYSRVLRPFGLRHRGGERSVQPRPEGMDDWNHFHKDPANSEHSRDTLTGHPRGLQWISGPTNAQDFNLVHKETVLAKHRPIGVDDRRAGIMARDAFSGIPMWVRADLSPINRFSLVMDDERVIIQSAVNGRIAPRVGRLGPPHRRDGPDLRRGIRLHRDQGGRESRPPRHAETW